MLDCIKKVKTKNQPTTTYSCKCCVDLPLLANEWMSSLSFCSFSNPILVVSICSLLENEKEIFIKDETFLRKLTIELLSRWFVILAKTNNIVCWISHDITACCFKVKSQRWYRLFRGPSCNKLVLDQYILSTIKPLYFCRQPLANIYFCTSKVCFHDRLVWVHTLKMISIYAQYIVLKKLVDWFTNIQYPYWSTFLVFLLKLNCNVDTTNLYLSAYTSL